MHSTSTAGDDHDDPRSLRRMKRAANPLDPGKKKAFIQSSAKENPSAPAAPSPHPVATGVRESAAHHEAETAHPKPAKPSGSTANPLVAELEAPSPPIAEAEPTAPRGSVGHPVAATPHPAAKVNAVVMSG